MDEWPEYDPDSSSSPPPPPPPPPPQPWSAPATSRGIPTWVKVVIAVVVAGGVLVAALIAFGVSWIVGQTKPYVDTANDYLDAVRAGRIVAAADLHCSGETPAADRAVIGASTGQSLHEVSVSGSVAQVRGTVTTADGARSVTIVVDGTGERRCVSQIIGLAPR